MVESSSADPRKRQRTDSFYPRRRNLVACNICRGRKSKCDNNRPSCGFCVSIGAKCIYEDVVRDFTNYDPASLHIINQLDCLEKRLGERFDQFSDRTSMSSPAPIAAEETTTASAPLLYPSIEATLEWPTFANLDLRLHGRSLALIHEAQSNSPGVQDVHNVFEEMSLEPSVMSAAFDDFLHNVHSKNPILDPETVTEARDLCTQSTIFDDGLKSALFAIICALGMVSAAFVPLSSTRQKEEAARAQALRPLAERCFAKGRAILASQPPSLLATQCLFFCGVYDMFCLRPTNAWLNFSQASLQLKLCILARNFSPDEYLNADGRLIQRLYWSCMQSECELSNELRMVSSGLANVPFPYAFPTPPDGVAANVENPRPEDLRSWMYYLSETSLRRIGNEVLATFYNQPPSMCLKDVKAAVTQADALVEKVEAWMRNVPDDLRIEASHVYESYNELGLHIRSRYLMCRFWIFRPFIYYMIHATYAELLKNRTLIEPMAYAGLECAMESINDATHHHRHHGTWYTVRLALGGALTLLAAARVNSIAMPTGWKDAVRKAEYVLELWSGESKNLQVSLEILQNVRQTMPG